MKIGICGCGFVGNAILQFLKNKKEIDVKVYDKYKNINTVEYLFETDIVFICLPTDYDSIHKTYNMEEINSTLSLFNNYKFTGIIIIKSTVLPDYCSEINNLYPNLTIIHNPEFLSANTAVEDFSKQSHIILGHTKQSINSITSMATFYKNLFPEALLSICTSEESALTKLACNSFYSTKIQYFTELYLLCEKKKLSYTTIKDLMLKNGWIHPYHTNIPGHDKQISFGGACFPKDVTALTQYMIVNEIPTAVLKAVIKERNDMRS